MHPGMMWWHRRRAARGHGCHPGGEASDGERQASGGRFGDFGGASFGVRRPLRYLTHKLDLSESQVSELAKIISDLKTERAQGDVDDRRTLSALADAMAAEAFDETAATDGAQLRVDAAERLREAVVGALERIHGILEPDQRERLAYLIRTGTLKI